MAPKNSAYIRPVNTAANRPSGTSTSAHRTAFTPPRAIQHSLRLADQVSKRSKWGQQQGYTGRVQEEEVLVRQQPVHQSHGHRIVHPVVVVSHGVQTTAVEQGDQSAEK